MKFGFIYLWYDTKRKKYYLGSHLGLQTDGYIGSNRRFQSAYKSRPQSFKRRILESHQKITSKELLKREQLWLDLIKPEELTIRYYNEKKVAAGGNIVGYLSEEKQKEHAEKSRLASRKYWDNITLDEYVKRQKNAFGGNNFDRSYMKQRQHDLLAKKAKVIYPDGSTQIIENISDFCKENKLNYGNFKTMLRGEKYKSCGGFKGKYL
jgi:hypothetical protein